MRHAFNVSVVFGIFSFSTLLLFWRLRNAIADGGHGFTHADWLINYADGLIRRGISGEVVLAASGVLDAHPLFLVGLVQASLTFIIIAGLALKGGELRMPDQVFVLLLSPGLVLFWINDTVGAFRKEILGLAAFVPLLFAFAPRWQSVAVGTTLFLFLCAVFAHEANIFMAPALIFAFYLRLGPDRWKLPAALAGGFALASSVFSAVFLTVPDTTLMCQRLIEAGLREDRMCSGILTWLDDGVRDQARYSVAVVADVGTLPVMVVLAALILLPGLAIGLNVLRDRERVVFVLCVMMPLVMFLLASDWSRWMSLQVFLMTFLILIAMEKRPGDASLNRAAFTAMTAFNLGIGIDQIAPVPREGFIFNFLASFENFTS